MLKCSKINTFEEGSTEKILSIFDETASEIVKEDEDGKDGD